jgi:Capsule assembly protein Wzi
MAAVCLSRQDYALMPKPPTLAKRICHVVLAVAAIYSSEIAARGVSPYLPLNVAPAMERKIERVLMLAKVPVMRRPIAAAVVLDALPIACAREAVPCEEVRNYLARYMHDRGLTQMQISVAAADGGSRQTLPNQHGMLVDSPWVAQAAGYYQPFDHLLLGVGGVAYEGRSTPTGTMLSAGFDFAQVDIGYRDHWWSPLVDSSMLISTQAPTMPSLTLSNYRPLTSLGFSYEVFLARMSRQENIRYFSSTTSGSPKLTGVQLLVEPASGYSLGVNRLMQYGGGARGSQGLSGFLDALFKNSNKPDVAGQSEEFGNSVASITSSMIFPGAVPFVTRIEYAGEDNAYDGPYRLGETSLSIGIDFPVLWRAFDLTAETSEWQNVWYTHPLYPEGLANERHVLGHWFGDQRQFGNGIGGHASLLRAGWQSHSGKYWQVLYRQLANDSRWAPNGLTPVPYKTAREVQLSYSGNWRGHSASVNLGSGRDVFGKSFVRLAGSLDLVASAATDHHAVIDAADSSDDTQLFVDVGMHRTTLHKVFFTAALHDTVPVDTGYHLGFGARRRVSERNDLGARLEINSLDGHSLISLRMLDYRYRYGKHLASNAFFGVGRYQLVLPAHGYYMGVGLQYMDVMPKWDLSVDYRYYEKMGRDKILASDPPSISNTPRLYLDANGVSLYATRHF